MIKILKQPYPNCTEPKCFLKCALVSCPFVYLFLLIFQPFGLNYLEPSLKHPVFLGYAVVCYIMLGLNILILPRLLKKAFDEEKWTVLKQIVWEIWTVFTIGAGNYFFTHRIVDYLSNQNYGEASFLWFQMITMAIAAIPVIVLTLLTQIYLLRKNLREAQEINAKIQATSRAAEETDAEIKAAGIPTGEMEASSRGAEALESQIGDTKKTAGETGAEVEASKGAEAFEVQAEAPAMDTGKIDAQSEATAQDTAEISTQREITARDAPSKPSIEPAHRERIVLRSDNDRETLEVDPEDILFIESEGNYVEVTFIGENNDIERALLRSSLKRVVKQLRGFPFLFKCHRSYIVNVKRIKRTNGNAQGYKLHLEGADKEIPVSRSYLKKFKEFMRRH
jgi:DNA-binding LytR/AlgR family response regulator